MKLRLVDSDTEIHFARISCLLQTLGLFQYLPPRDLSVRRICVNTFVGVLKWRIPQFVLSVCERARYARFKLSRVHPGCPAEPCEPSELDVSHPLCRRVPMSAVVVEISGNRRNLGLSLIFGTNVAYLDGF